MAFFCGAGEALGPLTIADIWFVDERAFPLAFYTASLSIGVGLTLLVDGWIAQNLGVQAIYWVTGSMIAMITVLVIFTFPETSFTRGPQRNVVRGEPRNIDKSGKMSYLTSLKPHSGQVWTQDSWLKLIVRPVALVCWPATLWAILIFAVDVGALAAVTTNVATAAGETYFWGPGLSGSAFAASVIGSILGIGGGALSDWWAVRQTKRNGGVREPEMRLLPMLPAIITMPLGLVLYGLGFQDRLHWIVFTIGLGLLSFSVTWTTGIALAYMIDTIRPLAEEAITSVLAIKAAVAFLLSFYTNPWIAEQGYLNMWGEFAAIATAVILLVFVFMFAGKAIRTKALQWRVIQAIKWHEDRDDVIVEDD